MSSRRPLDRENRLFAEVETVYHNRLRNNVV